MSIKRDMAVDLMSEGKYSEAIPMFLELIDQGYSDWILYHMIGQSYRFTNDISNAVYFLKKALVVNPNEAENYLALGIAYQLSNNYELAIETLKMAIKIDEYMFSAYNSLGLTYKKIGEYNQALKWYGIASDKIIENAKVKANEISRIKYADLYEDDKTYVFPLFEIHDELKSDPMYAIIKNNIGVCLLELNDVDSARVQFEESIEFIPDGYNYSDPYMHLETINNYQK